MTRNRYFTYQRDLSFSKKKTNVLYINVIPGMMKENMGISGIITQMHECVSMSLVTLPTNVTLDFQKFGLDNLPCMLIQCIFTQFP